MFKFEKAKFEDNFTNGNFHKGIFLCGNYPNVNFILTSPR